MSNLGQIIILNGAPRAGKSSIAAEIQRTFEGEWRILGVDVFTKESTPAQYRPGIGLRPGGERPDLEPHVEELYRLLHETIADLSRKGTNILVDVGYHDSYSKPLHIRESAAKTLEGLPVLFVGVRCPIEVIMERRRASEAGLYAVGTEDDPIPLPVQRWQDEVHKPGNYDLEVDTSLLSPSQCAEKIGARLESGVQNVRFWQT